MLILFFLFLFLPLQLSAEHVLEQHLCRNLLGSLLTQLAVLTSPAATAASITMTNLEGCQLVRSYSLAIPPHALARCSFHLWDWLSRKLHVIRAAAKTKVTATAKSLIAHFYLNYCSLLLSTTLHLSRASCHEEDYVCLLCSFSLWVCVCVCTFCGTLKD